MALLTPQQALKYCQNVYLDASLTSWGILLFGDDMRDSRKFSVYPVTENGKDRFRFVDIVKRQRKVKK